MQTKISSKGQVVLPETVRNRYQIQIGDSLEIVMERDRVSLVPPKRKKRKGRIIKDPLTGMACVTFGPGAPKITSAWVAKAMEDFSVIYLLDVDALIGLAVIEHTHRPRVLAWLSVLDSKRDALATSSITELGLVRILALPVGANFEIHEAQSALSRLKATSSIPFAFISDELGAAFLPKWVRTSKQTTDGHLLELAKAHKAVLATCDKKIPGAFLIPA